MKGEREVKRITVEVPIELWRRVKGAAVMRDETLAEFVESALEEELK